LIFHKECKYFERDMQTSRHHICATQVFEAFDTFEDIGEISSKRCLGTFLRLLRIWRCGAPLLSLGTPAPCEAGCALHTCSTVPTPCQEDHTLRQGVRESVSSRGFSAGLRAGGGWAGSRQGGEGRGEDAWLSWWVTARVTLGKRRSIIATVPAHGMPIAWRPQPSRAHLLFVFVVHTIL